MSDAQVLLWGGAGAALALAILAGWRERARQRRSDLDAVGLIPWPTVQLCALVALLISLGLALRLQ